jgi:hypothetical protein
MALLDARSCECMKSELDLFSVKPTQTSIEKGQWVEYHPISLNGDHGPLEFRIAGSEDLYIDLAESLLHLTVKITDQHGDDLPADAPVGPTNLFLHSLFSQVDMFVNQRVISASSPTYPYRAMIETLLSYDYGAKTSQLHSALYYKDTPGKMDVVDPNAADGQANMGLKNRATWVRGGKSVDLMGKLHCDMMCQEKYLLNRVDLHVKCIRSPNKFCLLSSGADAGYKVIIQSATLWMRTIQIASSVRLAHEKALMKGNAKYPINRVLCNAYSVSQGSMNMVRDNIFNGQLPKRVVIAMVDNDAYNGAYDKNPFNFKHHEISSLGVYVNGEPMPAQPLETKFSQEGGQHYINAYLSLFSGSNSLGQDHGNYISRGDFPRGYALFAFDLTPDLSDGGHLSLLKKGNLKLELKFAQVLPRTVMVLVYAEFDNLIEITRERTVLFDYSD